MSKKVKFVLTSYRKPISPEKSGNPVLFVYPCHQVTINIVDLVIAVSGDDLDIWFTDYQENKAGVMKATLEDFEKFKYYVNLETDLQCTPRIWTHKLKKIFKKQKPLPDLF